MTLDEFTALPEDTTYRYELQEGIPLVTPRPARRHQLAASRLAAQLDGQLPREWETVLEMDVLVRAAYPSIVRVPDIVITRVGGPEDRLAATDVLLAVEVISPGSRNVDLHLKPFEYAEACIPHYWLVDLDPPAPSISEYCLADSGPSYVETQEATEELITRVPFELRINIPALVARRGTS